MVKTKTNLKLKLSMCIVAVLFALPSFLGLILGCYNLTSLDQTVYASQQQTQETSSSDNKNLSSITNLICLTQGDEIINQNSFKQLYLTRQDIVRNNNNNETPQYAGDSETGYFEQSNGHILSGEDSLCYAVTVVGGVTINKNPSAGDLKVTIHVNGYSNSGSYLSVNEIKSPYIQLDEGIKYLNAPNENAINISKISVYADENVNVDEANLYYEFFIIQVNSLKLDNGLIEWNQVAADLTNRAIHYPGDNQTYSNFLQLSLSPSICDNWLNELYVEFWHNGKAYKVVFTTINGVNKILNYYASATPDYYYYHGQYLTYDEYSLLSAKNKSMCHAYSTVNNANIASGLFIFNESGDYKVRIYDNSTILNFTTDYALNLSSYNDYAYANFFEYNFTIINTSKLNGFYFTALSSENSVDINGDEIGEVKSDKYIVATEKRPNNSSYASNLEVQSVNNDVTLFFYNISSEMIQEIYYDKYSIEGNNVLAQKQIIANSSSINDAYKVEGDETTAKLTLNEEATYYFFITFKVDIETNGAITTNSLSVIRIAFQIINGIRQSYRFNDIDYPSSDEELLNNVVKTYSLKQEYSSTYSNNLTGSVESSFKLQIAKSNPTITGIANQKTTSNSVTLNISGVATNELAAHIVVKRDGNVIKDIYVTNKDEQTALNYTIAYGGSDLGNYVVTITDAMNNSNRLQFTIAKQQNAAGIILIIVGAGIGLTALLFIIRARSKVTVR